MHRALRALVALAITAAACEAPQQTGQAIQPLCGPGGCCTLQGRVDSTTSPDGLYYLTSFGGGGFGAGCSYDTQSVACGGRQADGCWYYAADHQRWPCHTRLRLTRPDDPTRCVVVEVADTGPDSCVETAAGKRVIDASPIVAYDLFGATCLGWSDARTIHVDVVPATTPDGPCAQHGECAQAPPAARPGSGVGAWSCAADGTARSRCVDNQHIECEPCAGGCTAGASGAMCSARPDGGFSPDAGANDATASDVASGDVASDVVLVDAMVRDGGADAGAADVAVSDSAHDDAGAADATAGHSDAARADVGDVTTAGLDVTCVDGSHPDGTACTSAARSGCACRAEHSAPPRGPSGHIAWAALALGASLARRRRVRREAP